MPEVEVNLSDVPIQDPFWFTIISGFVINEESTSKETLNCAFSNSTS